MYRLLPVLLLCGFVLRAQRGMGELRLTVTDPAGLPLDASVELDSQASQVRQTLSTDREGRALARDLPFGVYRVQVGHSGFAPVAKMAEIRSAVPVEMRIVMAVAPVETTVVISDAATLLDPRTTGTIQHVGRQALREQPSASPGRAVAGTVVSQPGWLLEANGVLHPRGSQYDTQYVVDGIPITDNRSPAFAPALEAEDLQSMRISTANYPAEYGRKLGGVVEVDTAQDFRPGFHGTAGLEGGSFDTQTGFLAGQDVAGATAAGLQVEGARTSRYLDPPVEENYTNSATTAGVTARLEHDFTGSSARSDRLRFLVQRKRTGFLVPNEMPQEQAGQRQDGDNQETMGLVSWERVFSPRILSAVRAMARDLSARLWSNPLATPISAGQDRGFREGYASASLSAHYGRHDLKAGTDVVLTALGERFDYAITRPAFFGPDAPPVFSFLGRARGRQHAVFAQDWIRAGNWTVSAGLRWDYYNLLIRDSAASPRLGAAWYWPGASIVFRASYDRAFTTPAIENILLASSAAAQHLTERTTGLPVPPSRGNFYQAGFSKSLFGKLRLDASLYRRDIANMADDDVLLNTGVSFPIAFAKARIHGFEGKIEVPRWGPVSGFVSYSNMAGTGYLPITGGLFLKPDPNELLSGANSFPVTQDQRNTVQSRARVQPFARAWFAFGAWYGSGLPVELEDDSGDFTGQYSQRILDRVNFERGRVRPSHSFSVSAGVSLWAHERRTVRLQGDILNFTNQLNVINFAGLFSGTALAAPRSFSIRLQADF